MQKEYNTKKYVVNSKVEEQNKETKGRHGKNAVCQASEVDGSKI